MSIHSLRDASNLPRRIPAFPAASHPASILGDQPALGSPDSIRKESCWDMIRLSTCPYFSPQSFISLICLLDIGVYALTLGVGWESGKFLTPTVTALEEMGAKDAHKLQVEMEIWRWFCPVMLHANPAHLLFNLFLQAIIGYRLEPSVGWVDTAIVYWASGCGGVLLSALCSPTTLGVGASASILGLVTGTVSFTQLGYLTVNWTRLSGSVSVQYTLCWLLLMLFMNLMFTSVSSTQGLPGTDVWGHLGGCIVGYAVGCALFLPTDSDSGKATLGKAMLVGLGVYFLGGLALFYMGTEVQPLR